MKKQSKPVTTVTYMKYVWESVKQIGSQMPRYRFFNNRRNWYCKGQIRAGRDQF